MKYINKFCVSDCFEDVIDGKLQCNCGEDVGIFNWRWSDSNQNIKLTNQKRDVLFHPVYSTGTAVVRGEKAFKSNMVHYWEVKILSKLYGTGVMIGVGTLNINLAEWKFRFSNLLGVDSESWGYSHHGFIQHDNLISEYQLQFGMGFLVGVCLDMCRGTLEYYVNRKPQGIAFTSLKSHELYPMFSSTIADSAIRTVCAVSTEDSLQFRCMEVISKNPQIYKKFQQIPGLKNLYEHKYFWLTPSDDEREVETQIPERQVTSFGHKKILTLHRLHNAGSISVT